MLISSTIDFEYSQNWSRHFQISEKGMVGGLKESGPSFAVLWKRMRVSLKLDGFLKVTLSLLLQLRSNILIMIAFGKRNYNSCHLFQINQTGQYGRGGRTNIAVPAQGIVDIRNALSEVLEQYGSDEGLY